MAKPSTLHHLGPSAVPQVRYRKAQPDQKQKTSSEIPIRHPTRHPTASRRKTLALASLFPCPDRRFPRSMIAPSPLFGHQNLVPRGAAATLSSTRLRPSSPPTLDADMQPAPHAKKKKNVEVRTAFQLGYLSLRERSLDLTACDGATLTACNQQIGDRKSHEDHDSSRLYSSTSHP